MTRGTFEPLGIVRCVYRSDRRLETVVGKGGERQWRSGNLGWQMGEEVAVAGVMVGMLGAGVVYVVVMVQDVMHGEHTEHLGVMIFRRHDVPGEPGRQDRQRDDQKQPTGNQARRKHGRDCTSFERRVASADFS